MLIVKDRVPLAEIAAMAERMFGDFVKAVVDVNREVMALDAGLHADEEAALLEEGSQQEDLWGINLYPQSYGSEGWLEFDSLINLRPTQNNRTRGVDDPRIRERISLVVDKLVAK